MKIIFLPIKHYVNIVEILMHKFSLKFSSNLDWIVLLFTLICFCSSKCFLGPLCFDYHSWLFLSPKNLNFEFSALVFFLLFFLAPVSFSSMLSSLSSSIFISTCYGAGNGVQRDPFCISMPHFMVIPHPHLGFV